MADTKNPASEKIDERILRLLGLENELELSYGEYVRHLKEALSIISLGKSRFSSEEAMLLQQEFKRVKSKKKEDRFKPRSTKSKINASNISGLKSIKPGKQKGVPLLAGTKVENIKKDKTAETLASMVSAIRKSVESIADTLSKQAALDTKSAEVDRRNRENQKRSQKESKLETVFKGLGSIAKKVIEPVKSLFDRLLKFIVFTLLGRAFTMFMNWAGDPKNADKVKSLGRFLKDWWPTLLGAWFLFATPLGRFTRTIIGSVAKLTFQLTKFAIPRLFKFARRNPKTALALGGAALMGANAMGAFSNDDEREGYAQGGSVNGPQGTDKVPAMLTQGEFVISKGAVDKFGADFFASLNAAGGGTNQPKVMGGNLYAATGGPVGGNYPEVKGKNNIVYQIKEFIKKKFGYDVGKPHTWGPSVSSGGGSGGFLSNSGVVGRSVRQVPVIANRELNRAGRVVNEASRVVSPTLNRAGRIVNEGKKLATPTLNRAGRIVNEGKKLATPTLNRAGKVVDGVKQKAGSTIDSLKNFDFKGLKALSSSISGAATEAIPALLSSTLGISGTDKSISEDMQRQLLQARATAAKRGRNYVDYKDYDGGGLLPGGFTAGGLTMGRIADKEWKRDAQGRIIGLRQVYDTNRSAKEAWNQGMEGFGQFGSSLMKGQLNKEALGRGVYKPFEALLALTQHRGKTMHDVNFDEKVLGFKPGKEVLNDTQKKMINEQKNREALQAKRPWWDKMGMFGGASAQMQNEQKKKQEFVKSNPSVKLYNKPQANTAQPYQSKFARPKASTAKPSTKPKAAAKPQRAWFDPRGWVGKQGGGLIGESTGFNIPGATADRQMVPSQPGEYMFPVDSVQKLGVDLLDKLVALTDSNSNAFKSGAAGLNIPGPMPSSGIGGMINLPPITQTAAGSQPGGGGSTKMPDFMATSSSETAREEREISKDIYGIVG